MVDGGAEADPVVQEELREMTVTAREALLAAWPFSAQANIVGEEVDRALAVLNELGFVIVPKEALDWLNGEGATFEPPPEAVANSGGDQSFGAVRISMDDEDPMVIVCAGPPLCDLYGDTAILAQQSGCPLCKRIICHPDGIETVIERTIN